MLVCDFENIEKVKTQIKIIMPASVIISSSGGSIILNLPFDKVSEMKYFILILNNKYTDPLLIPLIGLIKECGMDYTTLEEIFLKVILKYISNIFYLDYIKKTSILSRYSIIYETILNIY